jgi:proline iminopeptidase
LIRSICKYAGITVACLVILSLSSGLLYRKYLQHVVAAARTISSPNGIDRLEAVRIGGIEQWIEIRGQNVDNPILLFIHGGPGIAFIPLAGAFQGPWEKHFTVVQWDQRGAGKTYASNDNELVGPTMTVARMEQDTFELVNYLRDRFHREKIFVLAQSWGSILGLWLAHEHPDIIYAYVGVGQVVDMEQNAKIVYRDALQQARSRRNDPALKELESIAPYPPPVADLRKLLIANKWAARLLGPPLSAAGFTNIPRIVSAIFSAPEYSLADDFGFFRGQKFSARSLLPELARIDLHTLGSDFRVPIFFFEGRQDPYCRPSLIWDYGQSIKAPQKEFLWFDHSGHFPFFEEPGKFADELLRRVLPLANGSPAAQFRHQAANSD